MKVIAVTHATAEDKQGDKVRHLTDVGRDEAKHVAAKIGESFLEGAALDAVLTSPATRCVETVEEITKGLGFNVEPREVKELGEWPLSLDVFKEALRKNVAPTDQSTVLIGLHADLANVLSVTYPLSAASTTISFDRRPILAVVEYDGSVPRLRECLELHDGQWSDLLMAKRSPDGTITIGTWPTPE